MTIAEAPIGRLGAGIEGDGFAPGARLPTERALAASTRLGRTVVGEAFAASRERGPVVTRQGAAAVASSGVERRPLRIDPEATGRLGEVEAAGPAARRRTALDSAGIAARPAAIDAARASGAPLDGPDLAFRRATFQAARHADFLRFLELVGGLAIPRHVVPDAAVPLAVARGPGSDLRPGTGGSRTRSGADEAREAAARAHLRRSLERRRRLEAEAGAAPERRPASPPARVG